MPVLFSGASMGPGLEKLGNSVANLGATIYDKIDEAEAVSQFQTGKLMLNKQMNVFDQNLAKDPKIDTWDDKNSKAMDDAWKGVQGVVTNPKAANMLNDYWVQQKVARSDDINGRVIEAKANQLHAQFLDNVDSIISDNSLTSLQKKAEIRELGDKATATMVVNPAVWVEEQKRLFTQIDKNDLLSAGLNVMETQGKEAGISWMIDPKNSETLSETDRSSLATSAADSYQLILSVRGKEADTNNKKNVGTVLDWILTGKVPKDAYAQIATMNFQTVPEAGVDGVAEKAQAYEFIKAYLADQEQAKKGSSMTQEEEDAQLSDWYTKVWQGQLAYTDTAIQDSAKQLFAQKVGTFGAKQRFMKFYQGYQAKDADLLDLYKPMQGASPEEIEISRRVIVYGQEYFEQHPEITDRAEKAGILKDIQRAASSPYITNAVKTLTGWQNLSDTFTIWAGGDPKKIELAELYQNGKLQSSMSANSDIKRDYDNMVAVLTPPNIITAAPTAIDPTKNRQSDGTYALAMRVSQDKKKVYKLVKVGNNFVWSWTNVATPKGPWTIVK
jgi:hypothetical protein